MKIKINGKGSGGEPGPDYRSLQNQIACLGLVLGLVLLALVGITTAMVATHCNGKGGDEMYRQGDILIIPAPLPKTAQKTKTKTVAWGEATGHRHRFENAGVALMEDTQGQTFIVADEPSDLVHEEHATITIPEGTYLVRRQREFDGEQIRYIAD